MSWSVPVAVAATVLAALPRVRTRSRRDIRALVGARPTAAAAHVASTSGLAARGGRSALLRAGGTGGAAIVPFTVIGSTTGLALAVAVGVATWWGIGRLEPSAARRRRERTRRDLPFAIDLVVACLSAGAAPDVALTAAGRAVGGDVGAAFVRAASASTLGASMHEALATWRVDPLLVDLIPVARMLERSATTGAALVPSAVRLAGETRATRRWEVDAIARKAGVRATVPLGVCFLPAFVLLGVVPTVLAGAHVFTS